mmetsp:Transcript_21606/g.51294  ORF Transcript_21606/g.51294 Transcript_21606/m.51294 type:complete len:204 (+) Transcript_21606:593-1204(+)
MHRDPGRLVRAVDVMRPGLGGDALTQRRQRQLGRLALPQGAQRGRVDDGGQVAPGAEHEGLLGAAPRGARIAVDQRQPGLQRTQIGVAWVEDQRLLQLRAGRFGAAGAQQVQRVVTPQRHQAGAQAQHRVVLREGFVPAAVQGQRGGPAPQRLGLVGLVGQHRLVGRQRLRHIAQAAVVVSQCEVDAEGVFAGQARQPFAQQR